MTEFPELKEALRNWASEAIRHLSADEQAYGCRTDLGRWQRDSDGIFRYAERNVEMWDYKPLSKMLDLPQWEAVIAALEADDRLKQHLNTMVRTAHGGHRFEATDFGRIILPRPNEIGQFNEEFEHRYLGLDEFLSADEFEYSVIWPLPGLESAVLPLQLGSTLELDAMSDRELEYALNTGVIRAALVSNKIFTAEDGHRTCLRYRYRLPKTTGSRDSNVANDALQKIEDRLQIIRSTLEESLALILPYTVNITGRLSIMSKSGGPLAGGVYYQQFTLPYGGQLRRVQMTQDQAAELLEIWQRLHQHDLLQKHKGLALALRRLSYQAQRERPDDELLDTMIAAEALYLTDVGNEKDRGELRYRLALRTALWADPEQVGYTKSEVFGIMKSAYSARSAIAHGGTPDPKEMKVQGERVTLGELLASTKIIVARGIRDALARVASGDMNWPPDWDSLALGEVQAPTTEIGE